LFLTAAVVIGMLYFGFAPKGYRHANNIRWKMEGPGISFGRFGIAYTEPIAWNAPDGSAFSLEIALQPENIGGGFYFIMLAHGGDDARQLIIGQWQSVIVAMHGDDYDNRRKSPKVMVDIKEAADQPMLISLVSGRHGTRLYLNGVLKRENPALRLQWPDTGAGARLVLGNSVYGNNSWRGAVSGMAVYAHDLSREQVDRNYREWRSKGDFSFARADGAELLFQLDEGGGEIAWDRSGNDRHLIVPAYMKILKKEILMPQWQMGRNQWYYEKDVFINFFGFWPLGFLLAAVMERSRRFRKYYIAGPVLIGFFFSLSIELGQVWIPSRTSSLSDLILNTLGAGAGMLVYVALRKPLVRKFFAAG
jgi:VanZ family protein